MPRWCNGSHEGLKIPWSVNGRAGSSPALGTKIYSDALSGGA
jgi:hypothetical protein